MKLTRICLLVLLLGTSAFAQRAGPFTINASTSQCAQIAVAVDHSSTVTIDVSGTFSATLQPKVAMAGQTAHNTQVTPSTSQTPQSTITAAGGYQALQVSGWELFEVCVSSYVSGTATIYLSISTGVVGQLGGGGGGGGGDSITSPNNTLSVGGSSSSTTLDLNGAAGEIMAGATPALTATPTLGASGTTGSVTLVNTNGSTSNTITENTTGLTLGTVTSGTWNGTAITGSFLNMTGASCTNQVVTAISSGGTGTCTSLTSAYIPTLNQNTTGSAASLSISGQTGLLSFTGITSTNRIKTVRDAADTLLELGGSYTPTGTWTSLNIAGGALSGTFTGTPTFSGNLTLSGSWVGGTPASMTGTNITGIPFAGVSVTAANIYGLFTSCTGSSGLFLKDGGTCAAPSGSGTVNNASQYAEPYYSASGSTNTISGLAPPAVNGTWQSVWNVSGAAAVTKTVTLGGVNVDTSNPATLLYSDRTSYLPWTSGTALALPAVTTCDTSHNFGCGMAFALQNTEGATLTVTPNAGQSDLIDGSATATLLNKFATFVYQQPYTSGAGAWNTVKFPTFAAFGSTCGNALTWSTTTGFACAASFPSPGAIGGTTPSTGAFTTLTGTSSITLGANGGTGGSVVINGSTSGSATINASATGVLALPSGTTVTNLSATTPALGAATATSLLATGIVDGTAPITITTGTTANLGSTYNSGYTFNQEGTAGTGVTYTLPATAVGKQYCVQNSGTTGIVNIGVLTVYPPSSSFVILNGVVNTVGGGGTHGVASAGAAGDGACFVAIDATHWEVFPLKGTWTAN